jgi:hypothetical protein
MLHLLLSISLSLLTDLIQMGGNPHVVEQNGPYERIALTDSTTLEVFQGADSVYVVLTACAPQCSSCARIYNKEWQLVKTVTPPFSSIFPLAAMDKTTGRITWTDNDTWEYK